MYLSVRRFLNISVRLAFEAANIIEQVYRMSVMNKVMKGKDDPVTEVPNHSYRQTIEFKR
jgi:hypothetical protein